jgi:4-hydroxyphenylpyruvate dioxygenase
MRKLKQKNPLGIKGIDHVHFYVHNAAEVTARYCTKFNFNFVTLSNSCCFGIPQPTICNSFVLNQNRINFVFTQPVILYDSDIRKHVLKHGDGVRDVAFLVEDAESALEVTKSKGARIVVPLQIARDNHGTMRWGTIAAYGDVVHTFVERKEYDGFAPGYRACNERDVQSSDISLLMIDHVVANVENMREWVEYYERVFGFKMTHHFDDIKTKHSGLMSMVLEGVGGYIKLPINEPTGPKDQIQEFLNDYGGPGVQHIALLTDNIIPTIREIELRGESFLVPPARDEYYRALFDRVGSITESLEDLMDTNVLVDRESDDAYLLQIFTKRHPFFEEIIQRKGNSKGFGHGNFQALFEAIEAEQRKRGTLQ